MQNLAYGVMCDGWLCTTESNWCLLVYVRTRIIRTFKFANFACCSGRFELRSLWERKGNQLYVELGDMFDYMY